MLQRLVALFRDMATNSSDSQDFPTKNNIPTAEVKTKEKVTIIFDTCWLMEVPAKPWSFIKSKCVAEIINPNWKPPFEDENEFPNVEYYDFEFQIVLPTEVKQELAKHFFNKDKELNARRGRTFCASLMKLPIYCEESLAELQIPDLNETILGPDSDTDKKIIALALRYAQDGIVYVATHDGGIKVELSILLARKQIEIYTPASQAEFRKRLDLRG